METEELPIFKDLYLKNEYAKPRGNNLDEEIREFQKTIENKYKETDISSKKIEKLKRVTKLETIIFGESGTSPS